MLTVINQGYMRVGVHELTAGYPFIYSNIIVSNGNNTINNNETITVDKRSDNTDDNNDLNYTLNLTEETLSGYEIDVARGVTKCLRKLYNMTLKVKFIIIRGNEGFPDLSDALNRNVIDSFFSMIAMFEDRKTEVDFVCNTFMTEFHIAASANVSDERPDPNGPIIDVACFAKLCSLSAPPPFRFVQPTNATITTPLDVLINSYDSYEYGMTDYNRIHAFIDHTCPQCHFLDLNAIGVIYANPGTKLYTKSSSAAVCLSYYCYMMMLYSFVIMILLLIC